MCHFVSYLSKTAYPTHTSILVYSCTQRLQSTRSPSNPSDSGVAFLQKTAHFFQDSFAKIPSSPPVPVPRPLPASQSQPPRAPPFPRHQTLAQITASPFIWPRIHQDTRRQPVPVQPAPNSAMRGAIRVWTGRRPSRSARAHDAAAPCPTAAIWSPQADCRSVHWTLDREFLNCNCQIVKWFLDAKCCQDSVILNCSSVAYVPFYAVGVSAMSSSNSSYLGWVMFRILNVFCYSVTRCYVFLKHMYGILEYMALCEMQCIQFHDETRSLLLATDMWIVSSVCVYEVSTRREEIFVKLSCCLVSVLCAHRCTYLFFFPNQLYGHQSCKLQQNSVQAFSTIPLILATINIHSHLKHYSLK